jgi:hypothetical protein
VRLVVIAVCVGGVAGMIVTTVVHHDGAALTFGIVTGVAVLCLMVATAVTAAPGLPMASEEAAARVETAVVALVAQGADEADVRNLVRDAVGLGRKLGPSPARPSPARPSPPPPAPPAAPP